MDIFTKNKIYLDSASGAILNDKVFKKMFSLDFQKMGNPSSIHSFGNFSKNILEKSRSSIAKSIESHVDEIIFTGSGTESIALAIMGTVYKSKNQFVLPHVITSTIEHSATLKTCKMLEQMNLAEVTYISPNDQTGLIDINQILNSIKDSTVIISIHMVNSEIGVIQNIPDLIKNIDKYKEKKYNLKKMRFSADSYYPYLHIDACQAYPHLDLIPIKRLNVDMMSFNSVKMGGPAGIAVLHKRRHVNITSIYGGGSQEFGLKPGTINPMLVYGFSIASEILQKDKLKNENKYTELKKYFIENLSKISKDQEFPFIENSHDLCVPSIISISFPYFTGEQFAIELDARGVVVSSKSACNTEDNTESYVIQEIRKSDTVDFMQDLIKTNPAKSLPDLKNWGTIRISFSPNTQKSHINKLLKEIKNIVQTYRTVLY